MTVLAKLRSLALQFGGHLCDEWFAIINSCGHVNCFSKLRYSYSSYHNGDSCRYDRVDSPQLGGCEWQIKSKLATMPSVSEEYIFYLCTACGRRSPTTIHPIPSTQRREDFHRRPPFHRYTTSGLRARTH